MLTDGDETEQVETAECGEFGRCEGSVVHTEAFRTASVRNSILEGFDLVSPTDVPNHYPLNCEDPT